MEKPSQSRRQAALPDWRRVALYVALAFGVSWTIWIGLRFLGVPFILRAGMGLYGPALAATLTRWWTREGFAGAGLRLAKAGQSGVWRIYLAAYLLIPLLLIAGLGASLLLGVQQWAPGDIVAALTDAIARRSPQMPFGLSAEAGARLSLALGALSLVSLALPLLMVATFGEEFGWRGYLLPRLAPLGGLRAALLTGIIWGLWHTPVVALDGFDYGVAYPGYPWTGVGALALFTTVYSVIFAWLRFRSGSVWPSTLAHAALNGQATFLVWFVAGGNPLLIAPVGVLGILPPAAVALWLLLTGRIRPA